MTDPRASVPDHVANVDLFSASLGNFTIMKAFDSKMKALRVGMTLGTVLVTAVQPVQSQTTVQQVYPKLCGDTNGILTDRWLASPGVTFQNDCQSKPDSMSPAAESPLSAFKLGMSSSIDQQILDSHNRYRHDVGVAPLTWSETLARDAQTWADHLAAMGGKRLVHDVRDDEGENLWMGTAGFFSSSDMVNAWGSEKQHFRPGVFPDVSNTGNWRDVGHYTQMIWGRTTEVGCAKATAGGNDILVCRYSAPGNFLGQPVF